MNPDEVSKALGILTNHILNGKPTYHRDYDRVVRLSHLYRKLITGDDIGSLLHRYNPRESEDQFEQRVRLTQSVTSSVSSKIKMPFYKVARIDNVKNNAVFEGSDDSGDDNDKRVRRLEVSKSEYFGDESLDQYMQSNFIDDSFSDPNAFLVTEFDEFDTLNGEQPKPFPLLVPSEDAINFKYKNNSLIYLVVKTSYYTKIKGEMVQAMELRMYTKDFILRIREVEDLRDKFSPINLITEELLGDNVDSPVNEGIITIGKKKYSVSLINPKSEGNIQACRIGYIRDESAGKRTYVSPMHVAVPRMMKSIKATSEMDLTMTLHVHPQLISYGPKCPGDNKYGCDSGITRNGGECKVCNGTGVTKSTSSQESITLPLPRHSEDMLDLDKLVSYKGPDIALVKFMSDFQLQLETQAVQDVYTSESFNRIVSRNTLGEKEIDMESIYDTLYPFSNRYSSVYIKQVKMISIFTDNSKGISIVHEFPRDFKLKTVKALLEDRSKAKEANLPAILIMEIDNDIAHKQYANNPEKLMEYKVKQQHIPYKGKSDAQIQIAINMNLTTEFDKVLWSNYDSIFSEIEAEYLNRGLNFYMQSYDNRVEAIKLKTEEYIESINANSSSSINFDTGSEGVFSGEEGEDIETPVDIEAEAKAKLKGTVGGVQGIISINQAVTAGEMSLSAAKEMLNQIFGFEDDVASKLLKPSERANNQL